MYTLQSDEKLTSVMIYSKDALVRGEVVTKNNIMVSRWLRTQGAPTFMHLLKANVVGFSSGSPRVYNFDELYFPTSECMCFHLTPPTMDPLDYESSEQNRLMQPATILIGPFLLQGKLRVSGMVDLPTTMEGMRLPWLSFYEISISNPALPQFHLQVPMALLSTGHVAYGLVGTV